MTPKLIRRALFIVFGVILASNVWAEDSGGIPLSQVTSSLLIGGSILYKLMWAVCIIVGIALIAAAFTQFQIHRRNPKLVPLTTPVMYLILGIVAIGIPFIGQVKGFVSPGTPSIGHAPAAAGRQANPNDIDAPIN